MIQDLLISRGTNRSAYLTIATSNRGQGQRATTTATRETAATEQRIGEATAYSLHSFKLHVKALSNANAVCTNLIQRDQTNQNENALADVCLGANLNRRNEGSGADGDDSDGTYRQTGL